MVITVLEARIDDERVSDLERAYRDGIAEEFPPGLVETFLVRDDGDPSVFRIVTVWSSREALDAMRATGETPKGVLMFQAAGASPDLAILDVIAHRQTK